MKAQAGVTNESVETNTHTHIHTHTHTHTSMGFFSQYSPNSTHQGEHISNM